MGQRQKTFALSSFNESLPFVLIGCDWPGYWRNLLNRNTQTRAELTPSNKISSRSSVTIVDILYLFCYHNIFIE